jgi:hypothetical protein|eukprot:COSAG06_NODE_312_length_17767_cov_17.644895_11_plen_49_part_00
MRCAAVQQGERSRELQLHELWRDLRISLRKTCEDLLSINLQFVSYTLT